MCKRILSVENHSVLKTANRKLFSKKNAYGLKLLSPKYILHKRDTKNM